MTFGPISEEEEIEPRDDLGQIRAAGALASLSHQATTTVRSRELAQIYVSLSPDLRLRSEATSVCSRRRTTQACRGRAGLRKIFQTARADQRLAELKDTDV